MPQGGAIATIGCSGLGYGYLGINCIDGLGGWINSRFFYNYNNMSLDILGKTFTKTITDYASSFGMYGVFDRKTFEEWTVLGDPSLKIGGYPPSTKSTSVDPLIVIGDIELVNNGRGISSSIQNRRFTDLENVDWEIRFDPISPLGRYLGNIPILVSLLRGRVLKGGVTSGHIEKLAPGKTLVISSGSVFGFGHVQVNISIWDRHEPIDPYDDELLQYKLVCDTDEDGVLDAEEDGFLLGGRLFLKHPEE